MDRPEKNCQFETIDMDVCHVACSRVHMPLILATSHVDHEERVVWFFISMYVCASVHIVTVLRLMAVWTTRAPLSCTEDWQACYLLTSITWPYRGLRFSAHQGHVYFFKLTAYQVLVLIGLQGQARG